MKFIHIADVHASRERYPEVSHALFQIAQRTSVGDITAVLISGDFWDSTIQATENSHFNNYLHWINNIADNTRVIMIYGTPSHEPCGSLEVFKYTGAYVFDNYVPQYHDFEDYDIIALPEPRLSILRGNNSDEKQQSFRNSLDEFIVPEKTKPRIIMCHGLVAGMKYQNGQVIPAGKFTFEPADFMRFHADYIALGHVHMPSEVGNGLNGGYSGSVAPINFGETHDASYIEFEI